MINTKILLFAKYTNNQLFRTTPKCVNNLHRYTETRKYSTETTKSRELNNEEYKILDRIIRVDQAGETAAIWIYKGQKAILGGDKRLEKMLEHMKEQEQVHLNSFDKKITEFKARPTILQPVAAAGGFALGVVSAMLGEKTAMACTEAVETVIGGHYNDQLRELIQLEKSEQLDKLMEDIKLFRDQELEHLDTAVQSGAHQSFVYGAVSNIVKGGCKVAIWMCNKV
ncbi:hypothetical protein BB559_002239 [Furculomyces boomerangus]|uniref:5-demethoxyubiquinone hydroxylase, mitochondrial n=2 Tax=Harpellales TaxID=61421 RepID=A0A2T9YX45_9FUNG|nr:hypothetical protein BB559_002239 [Furculomyces boomerangus]PVZ97816.1 hypothetical protein BB558_006214 [Smittium angustum]